MVERFEESDLPLASAAISALGRPGNDWALQPLLDTLGRIGPKNKHLYMNVGVALGELGDWRAIEPMIEAIAADDTRDTIFGLGYFGLRKLTGVDSDMAHDGTWWRAWWRKNRHRFSK